MSEPVSHRESHPESSPAAIPNVLIVGETGVGKSSVINLIAGEQLAKVHSGAGACTLETTSYDIVLQDHEGLDHHIHLFDTAGINESQFRKGEYLSAIEKANTLICQLQRTGGVRLLLFCIRGGRITVPTQRNYRLFCDILLQNKVPVVLIVTGTENYNPMERWWDENESMVRACGLSCASHVCVTAHIGPDNRFAKEFFESQTTVREMLLTHTTGNGFSWQTERKAWLIDLAGRLSRWLRRGQGLTKKELARHLQDKCRFSQLDARYLVDKILAERQEDSSPALVELYASYNSLSSHVILLGGSGVGKSSVINLIAGKKLAETSANADTCAFITKPYRIVLQSNRSFCLWDTISLDEADMSLDGYLRAVRQAYKLIKELERRGEVHLLLFCMRGSQITASRSLEQNYKLFVNVLCKEKVPAYVVVTHLEGEPRMDGWWTANAEKLESRGIFADGHACITANPDASRQNFRDRYEQSRRKMCNLLLDSKPKASSEGTSIALTLVRYPGPFNQLTRREPKLPEKLVQECGFSKRTAVAIAASIEEIDELPPGSNRRLVRE